MPEMIGNISRPPQETELVFVQVSDSLMMGGNADAKWVDDYYATVYEGMPGYNKPEHFMELPLWIPVISGMAGDNYGQQVHIVSDVETSAAALADTPGTLLFSTIESNAPHTHELIKRLPHKRIIMGGHVNPKEFANYPNVTFLGSPAELPAHLWSWRVEPPNQGRRSQATHWAHSGRGFCGGGRRSTLPPESTRTYFSMSRD